VNPDHDRIEELLAGYALLGLTGEDAEEADRLLSEHVPSCAICRETLSDFQSVVGELGLVTAPVAPPDLLLPRIRRELEQPAELKHAAVRWRRGVSFVAVAASVAALVGLAGLSFSLGNRVSKAEAQRGTLLEAVSAMRQSGTNPIPLQSQGPMSGGLAGISAPSIRHLYIFGQDVAPPAPGHAYQLWLGANGTFVPAGEMFAPEDGRVVLERTFDPSPYDSIMITEEVAGATPSSPSSSVRWSASLVPAA
jgi:hypothetical protein